ncbi:MAG: hypothetical protein KF881_13680 [Acidobacteria bacterium]|nr:hypothetical protein [Acidobacteriota bacterium]
MNIPNLKLKYTLLCDDVRVEMGNKLSFMGIFQNMMVEQLPVSLIKFAVINHWEGAGEHDTEIRIMAPDRQTLVVSSQPTRINLAEGGQTDNISFFVNIMFQTAGTYWVQTVANAVVLDELPLVVTDQAGAEAMRPVDQISETVN